MIGNSNRKATLRLSAIAMVAVATMIYVGCSEENVSAPVEGSAVSQTELGGGDVSSIVAVPVPYGPIIAQPYPRVDLQITAYTTNVGPTTTSCGGVLPNVSCAGGQRSFLATVTILNAGTGTLAANAPLEVRWNDLTSGSSQIQVPTHPAIPPGGTFNVTRPYYMGPCDCGPPPVTYFTHSFNAVVDPNNLIPETNNGNNTSATYTACDGC